MRSVIFIALFFVSASSSGAILWDWSLNDPSIVVTPTEQLNVSATLFVLGASSHPLLNLDDDSGLFPKFQLLLGSSAAFQYRFSNQLFLEQFSGIVIEPNDSFDFTINFSPNGGFAEPGNYELLIAPIISVSGATGPNPSDNIKTISITVVPVPSALILFFSAILLLSVSKKTITSRPKGTPYRSPFW